MALKNDANRTWKHLMPRYKNKMADEIAETINQKCPNPSLASQLPSKKLAKVQHALLPTAEDTGADVLPHLGELKECGCRTGPGTVTVQVLDQKPV